MEAIKQAIARRNGGSAAPALSTQGAPGGNTPTGGPSTPTVQPAVTPAPQQTTPGTLPRPTGAPPTGMSTPSGKPQLKQVANFDEQTKSLAKALITKLMGAL